MGELGVVSELFVPNTDGAVADDVGSEQVGSNLNGLHAADIPRHTIGRHPGKGRFVRQQKILAFLGQPQCFSSSQRNQLLLLLIEIIQISTIKFRFFDVLPEDLAGGIVDYRLEHYNPSFHGLFRCFTILGTKQTDSIGRRPVVRAVSVWLRDEWIGILVWGVVAVAAVALIVIACCCTFSAVTKRKAEINLIRWFRQLQAAVSCYSVYLSNKRTDSVRFGDVVVVVVGVFVSPIDLASRKIVGLSFRPLQH